MQQKKIKPLLHKQQKPKQSSLPVFKPNIWFAVISAVVGFCLYVNTVKHDYVLDDVGAITGNEYVMEGISGIPKILSVGMWHFDNVNLGYYRPLSMITFAVENQLFPNNPHVSHLGNVILYAMTGFFLCMLLMNLFKNFNPVFSFIVTLLFLAHPVHTEVVANIKSRDEILAFLNLIIGTFFLLLAYKNPKTNFKLLVLSCVFFYLALLSKESAMTGLLIAPLAIFFTSNLTIKQSLLKTIPFALMILLFQFHKFEVLGSLSGEIPKDIVNYPYTEAGAKLPSTFLIFLWCIKLVLLPYPLSYDYSYNQIPAGSFSSGLVLLGFLLAAALAYFSFKGLLKKSPLAFGILIFCVTLAPALAFVFLRGGILAERFLYAPSLGFAITITFLLVKFSKVQIQSREINSKSIFSEMKFAAPIIILFLLYSFKTISRNPVWHDNMTLFSTDVISSPNSCQVRRHLGSEFINTGISEKDAQKKNELFNKGVEQLQEALRINPHFGDAFFKLGVAYQTVRVNNDSAIYYYTRAIQEAPGYAISYNNLGILYEGLGKQELASYYYNKAVEINPFFPDGKRNSESHKKKTGLDVRMFPTSNNLDSLERATPQDKRDFQFYYKLGTDYASKGDYANAARCLDKSTQLNPTFVDALVNLANCYGMLKNYNKNIEVLNKVVALYPNNTQALGNLAVTYELIGNKEKSEEYRDKVKELTR
ncbi:MAG: tetratricopeptide repeat protein [Bacteroidia bacterium]